MFESSHTLLVTTMDRTVDRIRARWIRDWISRSCDSQLFCGLLQRGMSGNINMSSF